MVNPGLVLRAGIPPVNILELTQSDTPTSMAQPVDSRLRLFLQSYLPMPYALSL